MECQTCGTNLNDDYSSLRHSTIEQMDSEGIEFVADVCAATVYCDKCGTINSNNYTLAYDLKDNINDEHARPERDGRPL